MTIISKFGRIFLIGVVTLTLSACAGSRVVQPLNQSQWQASLSFGGPLLKNNDDQLGIAPLSSVSGAYGVTQSITAFAGWHIGSYLRDVYHFDAGFTQEIIRPFAFRPGLTYSGSFNVFNGPGDSGSKIYPQLDVNLYWILPNNDFFYTGVSNWFEFSSKKAHGETQDTHWLPALQLGYTKNLGSNAATVETKYLAPFSQSEEQLINFVDPGNHGAIGLYFSVSRRFK